MDIAKSSPNAPPVGDSPPGVPYGWRRPRVADWRFAAPSLSQFGVVRNRHLALAIGNPAMPRCGTREKVILRNEPI
jgi:hypothetical protein